jgi:hypothetical protein
MTEKHEFYPRLQVVPRMGYEKPLHRLTWSLDRQSVQILEVIEDNLKARGNQ